MDNITIEILLDKIKKYNNNECELELIRKAFCCAQKMHENQKRQSGEPYIVHPLSVAFILSEIEADTSTICAALLHDVIEDTPMTKEELSKEFNPYIAMLVDGVTKISKLNFSSKEDEIATNTRKILNGITEDVRIVLIKLADRLHNMRTLNFKKIEKQKEISMETLEIFVPLAYYLGVYRIKSELEDLSFKYLNPEMYFELEKKIKKLSLELSGTVDMVNHNISNLLLNAQIEHQTKTRIKNLYGVYKKIMMGYQLSEIHDLFSLKIIVTEIKECYAALGLIHSRYPPLNKKFKDYISRPKTNLYKSLHTTIFSGSEQLIQTQIKTSEMDRIANMGITAYWQDEKIYMNEELKNKFQFFKSLVEINNLVSDNKEFLLQVKKEILNSNIYVYTPRGDIIELPVGSTVVDLAYNLGTELGNSLVAAMVNGNYVEPSHRLKNKDIVRVLTNDLIFGPNKDWINICQTGHAKMKIREFHNRIV